MYRYKTKGTCAKSIDIDTEGDIIRSVTFEGGCHGNAQGMSALLPGMRVEDAITKLRGIQCRKGTSCPDQLAQALEKMQQELPK